MKKKLVLFMPSLEGGVIQEHINLKLKLFCKENIKDL